MSILNWMASKLGGVPTIDENCRDQTEIFLAGHRIAHRTLSFVKGEAAETNPRVHVRLYFGDGLRDGQTVSFILSVSEDTPYPCGALVKGVNSNFVESMHREWSKLDPMVRFSFYGYALEKLGGKVEDLDFLD